MSYIGLRDVDEISSSYDQQTNKFLFAALYYFPKMFHHMFDSSFT